MKDSVFFISVRNRKIEKELREAGYKNIFFVKLITKSSDASNDKDSYDCILIKTENQQELRKSIDRAYNKFDFIFVLGVSDDINRIALENKKTNALVSPEYGRKKDFLHYRDSGLNHVFCRIAEKNKKSILENFNYFISQEKDIDRALILGKMLQNAKICKKYKTNFFVSTFLNDRAEIISKQALDRFNKIFI